MESVTKIMSELAALGNEGTKKVLMKHGAREPFFGVRIGDMKPIQKRIKKNYELALALYDTGNSDAQYLAGLIADEKKMTKADLQHWVESADWYMQSEYTVAWVAAESAFGYELALEWIESDNAQIATSGWATLSSLVGIKQDSELDIKTLSALLERVKTSIHEQPNRVRYVMNSFVISTGSAVTALTDQAKAVAKAIGKVYVDMEGTACKVPLAIEYIEKVEQKGYLGKKRKEARC